MQFILFYSVCCLALCPAQAEQKKDDSEADSKSLVNVVSEGVGVSADEALKDAFRNAVRQVVGTVIDAETMIKNDEVISDKVLTASNGYIKTYKEISKKQEKGLFRIRISASVERRTVIARLKEVNILMQKVDGANIAAAALTRGEARKEAAALLSKQLRELPKSLVAEVKKIGDRDYDEDKKELKLNVTMSVDAEKYKAFSKGFVELADKVSIAKTSGILMAVPNGNINRHYSHFHHPGISTNAIGIIGPNLINKPKGWSLTVQTDSYSNSSRSRWNSYILDCDPVKTLSGLRGSVKIHVSLLDKNEQPVTEDEFDLRQVLSDSFYQTDRWRPLGEVGTRQVAAPWNNEHPSSILVQKPRYMGYEYKVNEYQTMYGFIGPGFYDNNDNRVNDSGTYGGFDFVLKLPIERKVLISESDIKRVTRVKSSVTFIPLEPQDKR